jgi:alpha-tubulin suppressor-like RCC1 family protein
VPTLIGKDKWVDFSVGKSHVLAVKTDGTLWAWGRNSNGQLGVASTVDQSSPKQVGALKNWIAVAAGTDHSLGLTSDGKLWAWGANASGQLGVPEETITMDNSTVPPTPISTPTPVLSSNAPREVPNSSGFSWIRIATGGSHSLAIQSDGALFAWGKNANGQLGFGTTSFSRTPKPVGTGVDWVNIAAGSEHSAAIRTNGTLWAWGANNEGQLGDGSLTGRAVPTQVGTARTWTKVAAGAQTTFAIRNDGVLFGWGRNLEGQQGNGQTSSVLLPAAIP